MHIRVEQEAIETLDDWFLAEHAVLMFEWWRRATGAGNVPDYSLLRSDFPTDTVIAA